MKFEKKKLYYSKCNNGSYDIFIHNFPKQDIYENVCNWHALLKLYPKRKYNYIKLEGWI
jgi:hypothetical protein